MAEAEAEIDSALLTEGGESESEVRKKVKVLVQNVDESYMDLGRLLFRVHAGHYWSDWGFEDFGAYVAEELGFEERKAKYLLAIWKRFRVDLGVPASKLKRIGWSKAKELLPVVDEKNYEEWLDKARTMKVRDLQKAVQKKRGKKTGSEGETFHSLNLKFSDDQWSNVETAMEQAASEADSDKKGHLIDLICTEYLSGKIPAGKKLPWMLKNIERSFGVEVIAIKKNPYVDKKKVEKLISAELEKAGVGKKAKEEEEPTEAPAPKVEKKKEKLPEGKSGDGKPVEKKKEKVAEKTVEEPVKKKHKTESSEKPAEKPKKKSMPAPPPHVAPHEVHEVSAV